MSLYPFLVQLFEDVGYLARAAAAGEEEKLAADRAQAALGRVTLTTATVQGVGSALLDRLESGLPWHKTHKSTPQATPCDPSSPDAPGPMSQSPNAMDDYAGFARPVKGLVGFYDRHGVGLPPFHLDTELRRIFTRFIVQRDARSADYQELDTAFGRGTRRGRGRIREEIRNLRRRIDFDEVLHLVDNWGQ